MIVRCLLVRHSHFINRIEKQYWVPRGVSSFIGLRGHHYHYLSAAIDGRQPEKCLSKAHSFSIFALAAPSLLFRYLHLCWRNLWCMSRLMNCALGLGASLVFCKHFSGSALLRWMLRVDASNEPAPDSQHFRLGKQWTLKATKTQFLRLLLVKRMLLWIEASFIELYSFITFIHFSKQQCRNFL